MSNLNYLKNKKRIILVIIISGLVFLGFASTYSFINILGNTKNQNISAETGTLSLVFEDGNPSIKGELEFGSNIVKTFTIENTGTLDATAVMYFDNLINTYTIGSLTYTLSYSETEDGEYSEIVTKTNVPKSETNTSRTLSNVLAIPSKQKYYYNLTITLNYLEDVDQTNDFNAIFMSNFKLVEKGNRALDTLYALGLNPKVGSPNFKDAAVTDETADGLYSIEDDYGISYYFRGAVENNYVKFAGYYWRIARINGDGSLRLVYDGNMAYSNGTVNADRVAFNSKWNTTSDDAKYVGYMYGGLNGEASTSKEQAQRNETDSEIKVALDAWYKSNIVDRNYDIYIADNIFCNDRKTSDDLSLDAGLVKNTGLGYGNNATVFSTRYNNNNNSIKCEQKNDKFTVNDTDKGNGALTYPVGLLSFDEFVLAGSGYSQEWYKPSNTQFYLYKGVWQWTMTPDYFGDYKTGLTSFLYSYIDYYSISNDRSYSNNGVAPVINIKADYIDRIVGNGTSGNPYRFEEQEFKVPDAVKAIKNNKVPKNVNEDDPLFGISATKNDGIYAMEDDYGTSYYFRGSVDNNYVKFAGYYWRIIRINGDGSLRLIYDGTSPHQNGEASTDRLALINQSFNSYYNDAKYTGYMFSPNGTGASTSKVEAQTNTSSSPIKIALENWYKTNIADKGYDEYVSDNIFCNDRTTPGKSETLWTSDTGLGYGTNITGYGAMERIMTGNNGTIINVKDNPKPKFTCSEKNDAFTMNDTARGNGRLEQKVGLITADEIVAAGSGKYGTANNTYYLFKGNWYWSLSPNDFRGNNVFGFLVNNNGALWHEGIAASGGVAPVINLSSEYASTMIGSGYSNDSYRLE